MKSLARKVFLLGMESLTMRNANPSPEAIASVAKEAIDLAAHFERAWVAHPATQKANAEEDEDEPYLGTRIG